MSCHQASIDCRMHCWPNLWVSKRVIHMVLPLGLLLSSKVQRKYCQYSISMRWAKPVILRLNSQITLDQNEWNLLCAKWNGIQMTGSRYLVSLSHVELRLKMVCTIFGIIRTGWTGTSIELPWILLWAGAKWLSTLKPSQISQLEMTEVD